jgi:hypothetical protein
MTVDVLKIDVEDFEAAVLRGMSETILGGRPFIICEILPRQHKNAETRDILESLGYASYWITPSGFNRVSSFGFERQLCDFLLSPVSIPGDVITDLELLWIQAYKNTSPMPSAPVWQAR